MITAFTLYIASVLYFLVALSFATGFVPLYRSLGHWSKGDGSDILHQLLFFLGSFFLIVCLMLWLSSSGFGETGAMFGALAAVFPLLAGWNLRRQLKRRTGGPRSWVYYAFPFLSHSIAAQRPMLVFDVVTSGAFSIGISFALVLLMN